MGRRVLVIGKMKKIPPFQPDSIGIGAGKSGIAREYVRRSFWLVVEDRPWKIYPGVGPSSPEIVHPDRFPSLDRVWSN